ncbi:hypothetical protein CRUP_037475 [Coryphaenoides rupestris]|nr:hypothetical protein CRUP_037475 [Coryphaenoides rupestris]
MASRQTARLRKHPTPPKGHASPPNDEVNTPVRYGRSMAQPASQPASQPGRVEEALMGGGGSGLLISEQRSSLSPIDAHRMDAFVAPVSPIWTVLVGVLVADGWPKHSGMVRSDLLRSGLAWSASDPERSSSTPGCQPNAVSSSTANHNAEPNKEANRREGWVYKKGGAWSWEGPND